MISVKMGIDMSVLCECVGLSDKKKRVPAKKKESVVSVDASVVLVEKKKRVPAKKKETVVADVSVDVSGEVLEKKKRAPAKKKDTVVVPVPVAEVDVSVPVHVCAVAMKCKGDCGVCVESSRLNADGECDVCAHKSEILKKEVAKEVAKKAKEVAKADAKAAKEAKEVAKKAKEDAKKVAKKVAKKAKEVSKEMAKKEDKAAKKVSKKKMVASTDDADTVIMSPSVSPVHMGRSDVYLACPQLNVKRVDINGVSFLIGENDIAYLESSKKMVGKYDKNDNSIRQLYSSEYDEYYGASDDEEDSDEDECPVMSD
jgi:hypothetical protein